MILGKKEKLAIIGLGVMGQDFARELKKHYDITAWNMSNKSDVAKKIGVKFSQDINLVREMDIILVCVPISKFTGMIERIKNKIKKESIVMDVCSVKEMPMKVMKKKLKCDFIGTHPLFGEVKNFKREKIVLCPNRKNKRYDSIKDKLRKTGLGIIEMKPGQHDKVMGLVQGIPHFIGLNLADFYKKGDVKKLKDFSTTTFKLTMALTEHIQQTDNGTYMQIQKNNRYVKEARKKFIRKLIEFDKKV